MDVRMARITIRLSDEPFERLLDQAATLGSTSSGYIRGVLERFEGDEHDCWPRI